MFDTIEFYQYFKSCVIQQSLAPELLDFLPPKEDNSQPLDIYLYEFFVKYLFFGWRIMIPQGYWQDR